MGKRLCTAPFHDVKSYQAVMVVVRGGLERVQGHTFVVLCEGLSTSPRDTWKVLGIKWQANVRIHCVRGKFRSALYKPPAFKPLQVGRLS